jgi:ketosteroid isomerase-like protein
MGNNSVMTTPEIAARLVELCTSGNFDTALDELYADEAISIEPEATPEFAKETKGKDALIKKGEKFTHMTEELHNVTVSNPLVTGNIIAFVLTMDITMKGRKRMSMGELCVYQVKDGKIISEQFFM